MAQRKKKKLGLGGSLLLAALLILAYFLYPYLTEGTPPDTDGDPVSVAGEVSVHVIDVGQADAILLVAPEGNMLIDAGERTNASETALKNYLDALGITVLDYFVVTHNHSDHIGGADMILREYTVKNVLMTDAVSTSGVYSDMLTALEASDATVVEAVPGLTFSIGELSCRVLGPLKDYSDTNDQSIVLRVTFGEVSMMFTGDAEGNQEGKSEKDIVATYSAAELQSDFYKAGHHGSDTSSSAAFLQMMSPEIVAISVGEGNSYGHPLQSVLDAFDAMGIEVYRTDREGDLVFVCNGESITYRK